MRKTILKTLIVIGIGIGIFSIPFFIDNEPELIATHQVSNQSNYLAS